MAYFEEVISKPCLVDSDPYGSKNSPIQIKTISPTQSLPVTPKQKQNNFFQRRRTTHNRVVDTRIQESISDDDNLSYLSSSFTGRRLNKQTLHQRAKPLNDQAKSLKPIRLGRHTSNEPTMSKKRRIILQLPPQKISNLLLNICVNFIQK